MLVNSEEAADAIRKGAFEEKAKGAARHVDLRGRRDVEAICGGSARARALTLGAAAQSSVSGAPQSHPGMRCCHLL